ncbi:hypothetical protein HHK36_012563 [Tetracentron sinense]|uniref:Uncharacterized protein n=1 Tax=Tetracentron sinense TaxID=13715 RepID=A0A834ZFJ1_TETSI|nr:hypothetical protein HHK36_012563 [Tetracentron sinense]
MLNRAREGGSASQLDPSLGIIRVEPFSSIEGVGPSLKNPSPFQRGKGVAGPESLGPVALGPWASSSGLGPLILSSGPVQGGLVAPLLSEGPGLDDPTLEDIGHAKISGVEGVSESPLVCRLDYEDVVDLGGSAMAWRSTEALMGGQKQVVETVDFGGMLDGLSKASEVSGGSVRVSSDREAEGGEGGLFKRRLSEDKGSEEGGRACVEKRGKGREESSLQGGCLLLVGGGGGLAVPEKGSVSSKKVFYSQEQSSPGEFGRSELGPDVLGNSSSGSPGRAAMLKPEEVSDWVISHMEGLSRFLGVSIEGHERRKLCSGNKDVVDGNCFDTMHDYFGKGWFPLYSLSGSSYNFLLIAEPTANGTTEDAIKQLRSRRPMSRTEVPSDLPCKEKQSEAEEDGTEQDPVASSSRLICFELSNGHPYGPHVPTSGDDDQYVEYPLDNLADFPSNMEEEERMFMEAVIESLKDLEIRHPHEEEQPSNVSISSPESSRKDDPEASSIAEYCGSLKTDDSSTSVTNAHDLAFENPSPDVSVSSAGPTFDTPPSFIESGSIGTSARSDASASIQSSSDGDKTARDADTAGGTQATLTVQKNPAGHIMDGLMHRWGLNFFKNS